MKVQTDKVNLSLLMAMKGFPLVKAFPYISPFIWGTSASGLFEAKLGSHLGKENHIHTPAYKAEDAQEIISVCDHIVLNSPGQTEIFSQLATSKNEFGLRLNPEISAVKEDVYNPCAPFSRFGVKKTDMDEIDSKIMNKISGFHVHALCGSSAKDFNSLLSATIEKFSPYFHDISWINLGGGQALTEDDFDFSVFQKNLDILQNKYHLAQMSSFENDCHSDRAQASGGIALLECQKRSSRGCPRSKCHAELVSASTLSAALRFRNEFGMTQLDELFKQPRRTVIKPKCSSGKNKIYKIFFLDEQFTIFVLFARIYLIKKFFLREYFAIFVRPKRILFFSHILLVSDDFAFGHHNQKISENQV